MWKLTNKYIRVTQKYRLKVIIDHSLSLRCVWGCGLTVITIVDILPFKAKFLLERWNLCLPCCQALHPVEKLLDVKWCWSCFMFESRWSLSSDVQLLLNLTCRHHLLLKPPEINFHAKRKDLDGLYKDLSLRRAAALNHFWINGQLLW